MNTVSKILSVARGEIGTTVQIMWHITMNITEDPVTTTPGVLCSFGGCSNMLTCPGCSVPARK